MARNRVFVGGERIDILDAINGLAEAVTGNTQHFRLHAEAKLPDMEPSK